MRKLVAKKRLDYVWRLTCWGQYGHYSHITSWYVVDSETDEVIFGGYDPGKNNKSGYALIPRKKDALLYIAGYNAQFLCGPHIEFSSYNRLWLIGFVWREPSRPLLLFSELDK